MYLRQSDEKARIGYYFDNAGEPGVARPAPSDLSGNGALGDPARNGGRTYRELIPACSVYRTMEQIRDLSRGGA
jgi:hypothetical protein